MVVRIILLFVIVAKFSGCHSTPNDFTEAENLLSKFDKRFSTDCKFLYVQLQGNNLDIYQCLLQSQQDGFRHSFDHVGRETNIGNGIGGWSQRPSTSKVENFRQRFLEKGIKFTRFLGENPDYFFRLNFKHSLLAYSRDGIVLNDDHTPENIGPSTNIRLSGLLTGLGPILDGDSLSKALKKAKLIKVNRAPENPIFEGSQEITFKISGNADFAVSVFVSNSHGMVTGVEMRDFEGVFLSRIENFYRETSDGVEPDFQLFFSKSGAEERLERCLVFLDFRKEFEFEKDHCYMSFFGYPEPPLVKPKYRIHTIIIASALVGIVVFLAAYSYRKFSK